MSRDSHMATIKRAHTKLLAEGFLPVEQNDRFEKWIDVRKGESFPISFYKTPSNKIESFRVEMGVDRPEVDEYSSLCTQNLSQAIRISRISVTKVF